MSIVATISKLLVEGVPITVAAVGGHDVVADDFDELVISPFLDVFVDWAEKAPPESNAVVDRLVLEGLRRSASPANFREASRALLSSDRLCVRLGKHLSRILEERAAVRTTNPEGLLAAYALEAWFGLALRKTVSHLKLLGVMTEIEAGENEIFVQHAAKLIGAAYHAWGEEDLLSVLDALRYDECAPEEATFEYAYAVMALALDAADAESLRPRLEAAKALFEDVARLDPDRTDALVYASVIELVTLFHRGAGDKELAPVLSRLDAAAADRAFLLAAGPVPDWLSPRSDRDEQWLDLLRCLPALAVDLSRPSWYRAGVALDRLLRVYEAERTVEGGLGFAYLLHPRIESAFVMHQGLLAHLDDHLRELEVASEQAATVSTLRRRVSALAEEGVAPGKQLEGDRVEMPSGALLELLASSGVESAIEVAQRYAQDRGSLGSRVIDRIYTDVCNRFRAECSDYRGQVAVTFNWLLVQVIRFCKDRQDAGKRDMGARGAYLHDRNAHELELQRDLREFLVGNLGSGDTRTEIDGIAKGRADLMVTHGDHHFLAEMKRQDGLVTLETARRFVGQASTYQNTNVKLGFLGILELADREGPPAAIESCVWYDRVVPEGDTVPRHLLVFRVPGNLNRPSDLSR